MTHAADDNVDPPRWVDGSGGERLADLLAAAREETPTPAQRAAIAARLGVPLGGTTASPLLLKAVTTGLVVVAAAAAVGWLLAGGRTSESAPARSLPSAVSPSVGPPAVHRPEGNQPSGAHSPGSLPLEPVSEVADDEDSNDSDLVADDDRQKREASTHERSVVRERDTGTTRAPGPTAARPSEVSLIRAARGALSSSPNNALALTRTHRQLYPNGVLSQEREVIAIEALHALGRNQEALEKADSFRAAHPDSGHRPTGE